MELLSGDIGTYEGTIGGDATPFLHDPTIEVLSTNIIHTGMNVASDGGVNLAHPTYVDGNGVTHSGFHVTNFSNYLIISIVNG